MVLNLELDKLEKKLRILKPKRVLVQLPEGLKQNAFIIQEIIEKLGIEVIFSGETCWGGCSISVEEAKSVGADLLIHFGHTQFISSSFPILYIEVKDELDLKKILEKSLPIIKEHKILGLSYSIQHKQDIDNVVRFFEENGKKIILSEKKGYSAYKGHVIGCEFSGLKSIQEKVEAFIVLGNNFHSMGSALFVTKPVFLLDVYNDKVEEMTKERDKIIKQRIISIERFKKASTIGVIVETKPGQKFGSSKLIIDKLKKAGKKVILITIAELTPDKLMNFYSIDAFVELACPRIAIDDYSKYLPKTLVTYKEALCALGERLLEDLLEKGFW